MAQDYNENARKWLEGDFDQETKMKVIELRNNDPAGFEDAFYKTLEFGTGGLRGIMGVGTNRMNKYTVGMATQGLANYILKKVSGDDIRVCISYDSRNNSKLFAKIAADIFSANGLHVFIFENLRPTPELSYSIRKMGAVAGVMVTASHNPKEYNGYKVYGADGCQITTEAAKAIQAEINKIDPFADVNSMDFEAALREKRVAYIGEDTIDRYQTAVSTASVLPKDIARDVAIVYTPLNGTGISCVPRCLQEHGFTNITIPTEQAQPDGYFPTCPYPNPEIREALEVGLCWAGNTGSDLLLATDPDCDRVGAAVKTAEGYTLINGNEMGVLLLDFICKMRLANGTMPKHPVAVKTIVTTPMAAKVAAHYGVDLIDVLTGFKFIGEQIGRLEKKGEADRYIFGFEESYGYLAGPYVRDKDAIIGSMLICEMAAYYRSIGSSLKQRMEEIYSEYGRYLNKIDSFEFPGLSGMDRMSEIMQGLRDKPLEEIAGYKVVKVTDYKKPEETGLPAANVLIYKLENNETVIVRPSGTEPKIKIYYTTLGKDLAEAQAEKDKLSEALKPIMK